MKDKKRVIIKYFWGNSISKVTLLLGSCLLFFSSMALYGCYAQKKSKSSQVDQIEIAIKRSTDYLAKINENNGMFEYRVNMNPSIKVKPKYNILRHCGTIYSMAMYYKYNPDAKVKTVIERAGRYLQKEALLPVSDIDNMKAIWSIPEVNRSGNPLQAKLGGSGLGLVALVSLENITPGFTSPSDLNGLGKFIVYMQKENGSFYSKYTPSLGGRSDNWTSLYYPGEAALGLIMLYEKDSSKIWLESAYKALQYLAISRKNSNNVPADHWALLATERLLSAENSNDLKISRELLTNHAIQICESILRDQVINPDKPKYNGGFHADGKTTPSATRLEGLLAAINIIPKSHEIWKRINASIYPGITFLLKAQIKQGEYAGVFPRAIGEIPEKNRNSKKFNRRATEVRIDYLQHAISALMQYQQLNKYKKLK